ncbi:MAG TPA: error-prone DNA polymerase [Steroidobacteraceae bacterium]|nr:error-prone DNA polymerase [Steroidobacteraceae bacterium]
MRARAVGMIAYAELHCVSNFSFLRGASHPAELVTRAHELGYRALALTDECSMAGVVRAHEAAQALPADRRLQLIVGAEFRCSEGLQLVLLAPDQRAYSELCRLITRARRRAAKGCYALTRSDLESGLDHCLALWLPALDGTLAEGRALAAGQWLRERFAERAWLAVELHRGAGDRVRLADALELARRCALPAVASGDVHMHRRHRRRLQDLLTAIRHGCTLENAGTRLFPNGERHLRPLRTLARLYPPELLAASAAIAERCQFDLGQLHYQYPAELVPAGSSASAHLRALTEAGARQRWPQGVPPAVAVLLEKELRLIADLEYEHFFLTVHDVVDFARQRGILCQGRGSAANSAVCYALGITEVDPARMNLLVERFISRERREPPDIDVDFEHERREEVIQYIYAKYGRERTALAATVVTYRSRSARRDVERALGITAAGERAALAAGLIAELRGFPRHLSQHVGGFVISGEPLHELVPIENAAMPERTVIQWDKDDLETLGLLKVDVLALGMLTAIRKALALIQAHRGWPVRVADIPAEDRATYDMICRGETVGVFQIESRAQMSMLPRLRPRSFYDLVIEVAIIRPGPIQGGMVHPYLRRRQDPDSVSYPSPALAEVLRRTLGVPIFQEQVMQIAVVAAGFTAGEADQLRRSMAAWKRRGGLEPFRERLLTGMSANGYSAEFAESIYRQILGFGEYGFPESHAASFALLTYFSCWLKCHEPAAFIAALLNSQPMGFYQPAQLVQEARRNGVSILPPDVLRSDWDCTLERAAGGALAIRIGLALVRSLPSAHAQRLLAARVQGPFRNIAELAQRAALPRRSLQLLAIAGALRPLSEHRHAASWLALGAEPPPGSLGLANPAEPAVTLPRPSAAQEIMADYRQLSLSTTQHPLVLLRAQLRRARIHSNLELRALPDGTAVRVGGLVTHLQQPGTASGVVFLSLEDETGIVNVILWPQVFMAQRAPALGASLLVVSGRLQNQNGVAHVIARRLHDCSQWLEGLTRRSRDFH